jgi:hypothetical protein
LDFEDDIWTGDQPALSPEIIEKNLSIVTEFYKYCQSKLQELDEKYASPANGFVPISLSLTLDGISGIKIYNALNVVTRILPSNYPDSLRFIVKGVNHKISDNDWETSIETVVIANSDSDNNKYIIPNTTFITNEINDGSGNGVANAVSNAVAKTTKGNKIDTEYVPTLNKVASNRNNGLKLLLEAHARQEGFKPGNINYDYNNPGNFVGEVGGIKALKKGTRGNGFMIYSTLDDGIRTQIAQLDTIIAGKSKVYEKNPTLAQYMSHYDPGNSTKYTNFIINFFKKKGVTITASTKLSVIIELT